MRVNIQSVLFLGGAPCLGPNREYAWSGGLEGAVLNLNRDRVYAVPHFLMDFGFCKRLSPNGASMRGSATPRKTLACTTTSYG
jgi:hypothetical protein